MIKQKTILITVNVEDGFQVENFKPWIPFSSWDKYGQRVERNVRPWLGKQIIINQNFIMLQC
jgi:hypothetical protein